MLVRCLSGLLYRGRVHPAGAELELPDNTAARLIEAGTAEACRKAAPAAPATETEPVEVESTPAPRPRKKATKKKATKKKA